MKAAPAMIAGALLTLAGAGPAAPPPMELVHTFPMPGVRGRIDHLSADRSRHRIFVAALGNDTVEVVDTASGERRTLHGMSGPQGVLYLAQADRLIVANGAGDRVDIVDGASLAPTHRIEGLGDADNLRFDAASGKVLAGYGRGALRLVDPESGESAGDITLPGHPESFQLEANGPRAFVNVPSASLVVVVDRVQRRALARWSTGTVTANFPMALDERSARLFVGGRRPPSLLVYNVQSGKIVESLPICGDVDDLFFDGSRDRVYAICGEGRVDVIHRDAGDRYRVEASIATARGARTGLFVPEDRMLYVAAPAAGSVPARLLVFAVR